MKHLLILGTLLFSLSIFAQSPIGKWDTYDDEDGKKKSTVEIYKVGDKLYGKIIHIYDESKAKDNCTACTGEKNGKPLMGLVIIEGMEKDGDEWEDGNILDPKNGKTYDCKFWMEGNDTLKLRGYVGWFYRTQTWVRKK